MINLTEFLFGGSGAPEKERRNNIEALKARKSQLEQEVASKRAMAPTDPSELVRNEYEKTKLEDEIRGVREELARLDRGDVLEGRKVKPEDLK